MTRLHVHEVLVKNAQTTRATTGTVRVDDVDDVVGAADVAEVLTHALAEVHATVASALDQHQFVRRLAFRAEILGLADDVLRGVYKYMYATYTFSPVCWWCVLVCLLRPHDLGRTVGGGFIFYV